jgi:uncharacterized damage-inducible protein DinB
MPVAHGLIQAHIDVRRAAADLTTAELWARPGGVAAVGFHLRHMAGSTDRLFTYARGAALTSDQRAAIDLEGVPGTPPASAESLLAAVRRAVDAALEILCKTPTDGLLEFRGVGKAQRPSDVIGLLSHAAQHAQRHAGQVITTVKLIRGQAR